MLKIGEFSVLSSISIYMLRHYDKIGLLTPSYIDKENGYRYYSVDQLIVANKIQALKAMGFGLNHIIEILLHDTDNMKYKAHLKEKLNETQKEIRLLKRQEQLLENALKASESNQEAEYTIAVKTIPAMTMACCREKIEDFPDEGLLWRKLTDTCVQQKVQFSTPAFAISIYHDINYEEGYIDAEIRRAVEKAGTNTDSLFFSCIPEMMVASLIFQGAYRKMQEANQHVARWILENKFEISGPAFSIYHISPEQESNEENFITEFCIPIIHRN